MLGYLSDVDIMGNTSLLEDNLGAYDAVYCDANKSNPGADYAELVKHGCFDKVYNKAEMQIAKRMTGQTERQWDFSPNGELIPGVRNLFIYGGAALLLMTQFLKTRN